jgi:hypothetical protein
MNYLKIAEENDKYIEKCNNNYNNKLARRYNSYKPNYNNYYTIIKEFIDKNPIFSSINVIQLDPSAENGYPHTRPDIICIPSTAKFPELEITLYHEYIHIHQRRNRELWNNFLRKQGWAPIKEEKIPERWRERVRYNPDTIYSQYWCFKNRYVPLPLFVNLNNPKMDATKVMYYDLETGSLEHDMPEIMKQYSNNRQSEHPYELYAVEMERTIKSDEDILKHMSRWT